MIRVGIVGAGIWGRMHARAYAQNPLVELVAICDLDLHRAHELAGKYGASQVFRSIDAMLELPLDGISVVTPDNAHTEIVIKAARKGIHVLVEKPLATTLEECHAMIEAAETAGVYLMVDWHNRWNPPFYYAWKSIQAGELGDVRYIYHRLSDTTYVPTQMLPWASQSSVMWFLGSHALDTTCWLMGKKPTQVFCQKRKGVLTKLGVDTPDLYITQVSFEGGALAVIENAWILPQESPTLIDHKCEILGEKGAIYLDPTHHRMYAQYSAQTSRGFPRPAYPDMIITPEIYEKQMGFAVESIAHFVDCIKNHTPPLATGQDGLLNTRLILAAEQSAETGLAVTLD